MKTSYLKFIDILLIIISSAGLLHGMLFALYLMIIKKKKSLPNLLLGLILLFMAFRIGKSVMLNFGDDLEPIFIFIGLAFLLVIGPLLRWYVLSMTSPNFKISKLYLLEFIPFVLLFIGSFFVTNEWYEHSQWAVAIFGSILLFIYFHFAFYIALSFRNLKRIKQEYKEHPKTKSQNAVFSWLKGLLIGFIVIWVSYALNILDDAIPYICGPIIYSIVIYYLSFKAFQLKATDLEGNVFKPNLDHYLFDEISKLITSQKLYLESDLSLTKLSKILNKSTQQISSAINQYAQRNFNDYINYYRIQDAKAVLTNPECQKYIISSIAFDMGFSSLSSFNTAFKKFEGITPSAYRKTVV